MVISLIVQIYRDMKISNCTVTIRMQRLIQSFVWKNVTEIITEIICSYSKANITFSRLF